MREKTFLPFLLLIFSAFFGSAQAGGQSIPLDPAVREGKLSNGLTYMIRHNAHPKQRAEFYIAQKVGSILEEENQKGLAHFLEHMGFDGTKNFPGKTMRTELESRGIQRGTDINAFTGFDLTVYNLSNIPVDRGGMIDTALLVLHDWSGFITLADTAIDAERGVIREEWRVRNTAEYRANVQIFKTVFAGTQYADRMPIGSIDIINTFPYQALRDFYKKWYRPDLQAIIVVGDIDVDKVEAKIKKLFADIPAPINPTPRIRYQVHSNTEPIVSVVSDPELKKTSVNLYCKHDAIPDSLKLRTDYLANQIKYKLIATMFNQRLAEIEHSPNPVFSGSKSEISDFMVPLTVPAWSINADARNSNDGEPTLKTLLTENERMRRFGFLASELERAKTNIFRMYEKSYSGREEKISKNYMKGLYEYFTLNEPAPAVEWEYNFVKNLLAHLSVEEINQLAKTLVTDTNMVFVITGPKKDDVKLPTKEQIIADWKAVKNEKISPYVDTHNNQTLIDKKPVAGKIIKTAQKPFGYTQWTLSNGVKVLYKKTDFEKGSIEMSAQRWGGQSVFSVEELPSAKVITDVVPLGGYGKLNSLALDKLLGGKEIWKYMPMVNELDDRIIGRFSPRSLETLLQLNYLYFTQPRMDQDAFNNWMADKKVKLENNSSNPENCFSEAINKYITNNSPYGKPLDLDMLNKVTYSKVIELHKKHFGNARDFTFIFTGNVDVDTLKNLAEIYLGGLPSQKQIEGVKDRGIYTQKGIVKNHFSKKMQTPQTSIAVYYTGVIPYNLKNMILMDYLTSIFLMIYTENIREKEGGTYGIGVGGSLSKIPKESFSLRVKFNTDPAKADKLIGIVYDEVKKMTSQGPTIEHFNKVQNNKVKSNKEMTVYNGYWSDAMLNLMANGVDKHTDYEKIASSVTPEMVRDFAIKIFAQGNIAEIVMSPEQ